jgi:hypothetical protein
MSASRFAGQRLLAEGPRVLLKGDLLDLAYGLGEEADKAFHWLEDGRRITLPVGPEMQDAAGNVRQLELSASLSPPGSVLPHPHEGQVALLKAMEGMANLGPRPVMNTSFGWETRRGSIADQGLLGGGPYYDTPSGIDVRGVNYEQEIRRAFLEAIERLKLKPGDLVANSPLRSKSNRRGSRPHMGRELSYMKHGGFGPVSQGGMQHGRVNDSGLVEPELMTPADDAIMARMGWRAGPLVDASGAALGQSRPGILERGRSYRERNAARPERDGFYDEMQEWLDATEDQASTGFTGSAEQISAIREAGLSGLSPLERRERRAQFEEMEERERLDRTRTSGPPERTNLMQAAESAHLAETGHSVWELNNQAFMEYLRRMRETRAALTNVDEFPF